MKKFMEKMIKHAMGKKENADKKKLKGFTLVEIIVVLVILAILAAAMIPALTGYIDKANEKTAISEARNVVMAAQTLASEKYALGLLKDPDFSWADHYNSIITLADTSGGTITGMTVSANGKVSDLTYKTSKNVIVTYAGGTFTIESEVTTTAGS